MPNIIESLMIRSIDRLYPEQGWIPKVSAFGIKLKQRLDNFHFDVGLLDLQHPNLQHLVKTCYAYARHLAYEGLEIESQAWAKIYFIDCYFVHRADADGYFYAILYPRYFIRSISLTFREIGNYFKQKALGDKAPLTTIQLCLAAYYTHPVIETTP